ncbi:MAG: hypothetical protein KDB00_02855 [Planctomycetales bacterium]|nr:hypothetical protein [Planctomycetales bacterium]
MKCVFLVVFVVFGLIANDIRAQESTESSLAHQIEILELKLKLSEAQIEQLQKENDALRKQNAGVGKEAPDEVVDENDPFAVGVVWLGVAKRTGSKEETRWALSVSHRDGQKLEGAIAVIAPDGKKLEFPVTGTAPRSGNGVVVIETPMIGRAKLFARGTLRNGAVALAFSGTNPLGKKDFGSATLSPKN